MHLRFLAALALVLQPATAFARTIVLSNDDGLTSNVKALYEALKAEGHDVIVSVPCANQSGMGAAIQFMEPLGPLKADCRSHAAKAGEPGAGPMTRAGFEKDFFYVDGTPVMAMLYGLDVVAAERWGRAPDLVLSGPNEGQNIGSVVISSGTVSNAQYAIVRGIPAIALSGSASTADDEHLANPGSQAIAGLIVHLVKSLDERSNGQALLPSGVALNVNFPDELEGAQWKLARIGTYDGLRVKFAADRSDPSLTPVHGLRELHGPGIVIASNPEAPRDDQKDDESVVVRKDIAVSVMQASYDHQPSTRERMKRYLRGFLGR